MSDATALSVLPRCLAAFNGNGQERKNPSRDEIGTEPPPIMGSRRVGRGPQAGVVDGPCRFSRNSVGAASEWADVERSSSLDDIAIDLCEGTTPMRISKADLGLRVTIVLAAAGSLAIAGHGDA